MSKKSSLLRKLDEKKIHCLQDVSKKDFPCGDLKEEKGIQVLFLFGLLHYVFVVGVCIMVILLVMVETMVIGAECNLLVTNIFI